MKKGIMASLRIAVIPFFFISLFTFLAFFYFFILPITLHAYTSPGKAIGFVNDFANILSIEQRSQLEIVLSDFKKQNGDEITIVTVTTLGDETVENYAVKLFEEWGIGEKGKDNGLLILHALDERKIWIEVGYGLEAYITDAKAGSIYRNILSPAFKKGAYAQGYNEAVTAIINTLNGQVDVISQDSAGNSDGDWGVIIYFLLFIPIWLASILGRSKSWWAGGVLGGIAGIIIGFVYSFIFIGIIWTIVLIIIGLFFDFFVSKAYHSSVAKGKNIPWWIGGGGRSGGFGGGFGGFGGGGSGGGGGGGGD